MIAHVFFQVLDVLVYPLFWLSTPVSLSLVSALVGLVLMGLYARTSDQWALAHHKQQMQDLQFQLLSEGWSSKTLSELAKHNLRMAGYGIVPAVLCILLLVALIPWVGNRFGYHPITPMQPFSVTVESQRAWQAQKPHTLRVSPSRGTYPAGTTRLRLLAETPGILRLRLQPTGGPPVEIPLQVARLDPPLWPTISPPQWYHALINPAGRTVPDNSSVQGVKVHYPMAFSSLSFTFPALWILPAWSLWGWLTWMFIVATISGLWAKWYWEIE